jgi:two-component system, OmpR family, osmolarity sensor histidine kinase EnvZ
MTLWFPRSLLARTALVMLFALAASQALSVVLFRYYSREPRIQLAAIGYITQLRTIRAALETIPAEQHAEFLKKLREERGVRVLRPRADEVLEPAPDVPALRVVRERLRAEFGTEADVYTRPQAKAGTPPTLVTKIEAANTQFWVVFPRGRIVEQDYSSAWIGWGVFGALMALAAAVFVVSRVTSPLRNLADAARELGKGRNPSPVAVTGPSEVRAVAQAFNQMRDDLARSEKERANFLAGVSHDLRTPLARMRLGIEMLPADPATRTGLESDIEDMNSIIEQFMDFARDESVEQVEVTDVNALLRKAADRSARLGASPTLALGKPPLIRLRPLAMQRAINNLVDNAIKHAGGNITLASTVTASELHLSVLDRGPGIPANEIERLKQPFTRLDEARSGISGAGLGLAIVDRIARTHGGIFQLLPRDGGGIEARISMPLVAPINSDTAAAKAAG